MNSGNFIHDRALIVGTRKSIGSRSNEIKTHNEWRGKI